MRQLFQALALCFLWIISHPLVISLQMSDKILIGSGMSHSFPVRLYKKAAVPFPFVSQTQLSGIIFLFIILQQSAYLLRKRNPAERG